MHYGIDANQNQYMNDEHPSFVYMELRSVVYYIDVLVLYSFKHIRRGKVKNTFIHHGRERSIVKLY